MSNNHKSTIGGLGRRTSSNFEDADDEPPFDPFERLDAAGVGQLVETAVRLGRRERPGLKNGICGEHGGDPASIAFFQKCGLDYVSCSPFRVPVARLAAAQAALKA